MPEILLPQKKVRFICTVLNDDAICMVDLVLNDLGGITCELLLFIVEGKILIGNRDVFVACGLSGTAQAQAAFFCFIRTGSGGDDRIHHAENRRTCAENNDPFQYTDHIRSHADA